MGDDNFSVALVNKVRFLSKDRIYDVILKGYTMLHVATGKKPDAMLLDGMSQLSTDFICERFLELDILELENIFKMAMNGQLGEFKYISHIDFVKWAWAYNNFHRKTQESDPEKDKDENQRWHIYKRQTPRRQKVLEDRFWDAETDDDPNDKLILTMEDARHLDVVSAEFYALMDKHKVFNNGNNV